MESSQQLLLFLMFLYSMLDFFCIQTPCVLLGSPKVCVLSAGKVGDEECAIIYPPNGELLSVAEPVYSYRL